MRPCCRVEVREGPGRGTTHGGADAAETSCQPAETEHGLKVGVFPKGKLPPRVDPTPHVTRAQKHAGVEDKTSPEDFCFFAVSGDVVSNSTKINCELLKKPPVGTGRYLFGTVLTY